MTTAGEITNTVSPFKNLPIQNVVSPLRGQSVDFLFLPILDFAKGKPAYLINLSQLILFPTVFSKGGANENQFFI